MITFDAILTMLRARQRAPLSRMQARAAGRHGGEHASMVAIRTPPPVQVIRIFNYHIHAHAYISATIKIVCSATGVVAHNCYALFHASRARVSQE